jgi:Kef-type K+ transport system membrane component KefB
MNAEHARTLIVLGLLLISGILAGRVAARLRLPALTGHLVAGVAFGAVNSSWITSSSELLSIIRQAVGSVLLVWIGSQLNLERLRLRTRVVAGLAAATVVSALICGVALAFPLPRLFPSDLWGALSVREIFVAALVVSATSPTVIAVISCEHSHSSRFAQTSLDATVLANTVLTLLVLLTLGLVPGGAESSASSPLQLVADLAAGLAVGGALGALAAFGSRSIPDSLVAALGGVAFLILRQQVVHAEAAIMAGSFFAGVALAQSNRDRPIVTQLPRAIPLVSPILFLVSGALVDVDLMIAASVPALLLFAVRAASLWLGTRAAGSVSADPVVRRFGFAPLLPQAGFSLAILGALDGPRGVSVTLSSVIVAVVVINEIVMPPVARFALRASERDLPSSHAGSAA